LPSSPENFGVGDNLTSLPEIWGHIPIEFAGFYREMDLDDFPELQRKTWIDYQEKNKISYPIKEYLQPTEYVTIVDYAHSEQMKKWVSFSRVGFNSSLKQALVLVGDCSGEACYDSKSNNLLSVGYFVVLQKENEKWKVMDRPRLWFIEAPSP
jgi:hypothetical protein